MASCTHIICYQCPGAEADFESVEMDDSAGRPQVRVKVPRRTIFFASGETMEEYSTDEEEEEEEPVKKDLITVDSVGWDQTVLQSLDGNHQDFIDL